MPTPAHMLHQNEPVGVKLLVLGVASVGKTSLIHRFTLADQQWLPEGERNPTIGVDSWVHKFDIKGKRVVLNIWDTAGDERLRALTTSYYRGTQGIILVYDVTNRESFETISWWFAERSKLLPVSAVKPIVGNKADKSHAAGLCGGGRSIRRSDGLFVPRDVCEDRRWRERDFSPCRRAHPQNLSVLSHVGDLAWAREESLF